jgi:hypothetical protein
VTDRSIDPDRRAWHLAAAAARPDEDVARELELSAGWAKARGGQAAAAAFLQRAVALTRDPARRADRALAAAQASLGAGTFDAARGLLATTEAGPLDELGRARIDLLHAEIVFAQSRGSDAPLLLLQAARKLAPLDVRLARHTYLDAWGAALFAGHLASAGGGLLDVSRAAATAPRSRGSCADPRPAADRPPRQRHDAGRRTAGRQRAAAPPGRPDRGAAPTVHRTVQRQGAWSRLRVPLPLRRLRALPHRPSNQAELRDYLHQLLAGRERLAAAVPQLADWARRDATPSDEEIAALRQLIRGDDQIIDELDPADRAAVLDAIATTRRFRAQLRVTIPDRFKGINRPLRPTLVPRPAGGAS